MRHVITIMPCGGLHALQKAGGLPLTSLGRARINRISEILWDEESQRWFVQFLHGPLAGRPVTGEDLTAYSLPFPRNGSYDGCECIPLFDNYEDAVACEVALVEAAAARGEHWGWDGGWNNKKEAA